VPRDVHHQAISERLAVGAGSTAARGKRHLAVFVAAMLFVVRPATIGLATIAAPMRREDKLLLAWIAPRGIVAAAAASIFGPGLVARGYADAERLLPIVFLLIIVTALVHGLSIGVITRRLDLAARSANGALIVGANRWTHALAAALRKLRVDVLVADASRRRLAPFREHDIDTYHGEILSEDAEQGLDVQHLSFLLAATDNDFYNALVCKARGGSFGRHRSLQLATNREAREKEERMTLQHRGYTAFGPEADYDTLVKQLEQGWTMQIARLDDDFGLQKLDERLGERGDDWLLLAGLSSQDKFALWVEDQPFTPGPGWTVLYFGPEGTGEAPGG